MYLVVSSVQDIGRILVHACRLKLTFVATVIRDQMRCKPTARILPHELVYTHSSNDCPFMGRCTRYNLGGSVSRATFKCILHLGFTRQSWRWIHLQDIEGLRTLSYAPVHCKCRAVLNPYCSLDFSARAWVCPMWYFPAWVKLPAKQDCMHIQYADMNALI